MPSTTRILRNAVTGLEYKLLRTSHDTNGEQLEMEVTYPPGSRRPPLHYHPYQTEHFRVVSGEMTVVIKGQLQVMKTGDTFDTLPNNPHAMWNQSDQPTVLHWTTTPALRSEQLFATMTTLANEGKTNRQGVPNLLQTALTMRHFSREFRPVKPSFPLQQLLFGVLAPIARLLGYRAVHG